MRPLTSNPHQFESYLDRRDSVRNLSIYLQKVDDLSPNTLYNVSGFPLPPIKTYHHHITEKLLSGKNLQTKQNKKQTKKTSFRVLVICLLCSIILDPWLQIGRKRNETEVILSMIL
jgi:hypothetical protein